MTDEALDALVQEIAKLAWSNADVAAAAITTLRAQLAKAVEALRPFANIGIGSDPDYQPMIRMDRAAIIAARAAIARVKGETK